MPLRQMEGIQSAILKADSDLKRPSKIGVAWKHWLSQLATHTNTTRHFEVIT